MKQKSLANDMECDDMETLMSDPDNKRITTDNHQENTDRIDLKPCRSEDEWDSMDG